jgi:beta-glucosidase
MQKALYTIIALFLMPNWVIGQAIDYKKKAKDLVAQMTLEEKASLLSGQTEWTTKAIDRLGIPAVYITDGPHGVRKAKGFDIANTVPSTCFPTASALASSWNPELMQKMGQALGIECQANDVQILLGPGVNMKRSPLGGRNFEYFSEDPILTGKMAAALIMGMQSQGIGASLKHFAANNQEFERMTMNSSVDERTLYEIYLPAFEIAIKEAKPLTVMCSYNQVNGVYASQNSFLLNEVLKRQWGFGGLVMSDWGAVDNRVAGVQAGLHLEMPGNGGLNDKKVIDAIKSNQLSESRLDQIVTESLSVILQVSDSHRTGVVFDKQKHNDLARQVSSECIVLLKNKESILPLRSTVKKVAVIGVFAQTPRYQGAGSSKVRPTQLSNAFDELQKLAPGTNFIYSPGYSESGETSQKLIDNAVQNAKAAATVLVFVGLPDNYESEGLDRKDVFLPQGHNKLIEELVKANSNVVVVLMNGSAVAMPWANNVKGIVEGWLGGQAGGGALADVLTGKINPSGKLSETFPVRLEDTPTFLDFPDKDGTAIYGEGVFIGYRYYEKKKIEPAFPFGYGLSYTTFAYSAMEANGTLFKDTADIRVSFKVKNTGQLAGKEVTQLYIHEQNSVLPRPENELKHFEKIFLRPGEEKVVTFHLNFRDFAYYNTRIHDWVVNSGKFDIRVGGDSRNLILQKTINIEGTKIPVFKLTPQSMVKVFKNHPKGNIVYKEIIRLMSGSENPESKESKNSEAIVDLYFSDMPVHRVTLILGSKFTEGMLEKMLKTANADN